MNSVRNVLLTVASVLAASVVSAGPITVFSGQDDGAGTGGPFPGSTAAQTAFLAAAGPLDLLTFESLATGYTDPIAAATGVTIAIGAPNYGVPFSGINDTTFGGLYGFNTTAGGDQWLGFPNGSATFQFASGVSAFGMWITGIQTGFTSTFALMFNDGSSQTLNIPINVAGGAQFFGFTDPGASIAAITIQDISGDAWGIDDVRYSSQAVPEPTTLLLFGSGLAAAALRRRRKTQVQ